MTEPQVVIITGMHRSGTSLTASLLQHAGVYLGKDLNPPNSGNKRGYFEDLKFYKFQEKLLKRLGFSYLVQDGSFLGEPTPDEVEAAEALIEERKNLPVWGWKDPRSALFLDFWNSLLPQAQFIFVYRHPLEVALSLLRRGLDCDLEVLLDPLAALRSWQVHNRQILQFYKRYPHRCVLAHIAAITGNVEGFINLSSTKLGLPLQANGAHTLYASDELKQFYFSAELKGVFEAFEPEAVRLYEELQRQADLPGPTLNVSLDIPSELLSKTVLNLERKGDAVGFQPHQFKLFLTFIDPQVIINSQAALDQLRLTKTIQLEQQIKAQEVRLANLETQDHHWRTLAQERQVKLEEQKSRIQEQNTHLQEQKSRIQEQNTHLQEQQVKLDQLQTQLQHQKSLLKQQEDKIIDLEAYLANIYQTRSWGLIVKYWSLKQKVQDAIGLGGRGK